MAWKRFDGRFRSSRLKGVHIHRRCDVAMTHQFLLDAHQCAGLIEQRTVAWPAAELVINRSAFTVPGSSEGLRPMQLARGEIAKHLWGGGCVPAESLQGYHHSSRIC